MATKRLKHASWAANTNDKPFEGKTMLVWYGASLCIILHLHLRPQLLLSPSFLPSRHLGRMDRCDELIS